MQFMVGTMDNSIPATCRNAEIGDALGFDCSGALTQEQENNALGLAAEIAVSLYGDNADAFIK